MRASWSSTLFPFVWLLSRTLKPHPIPPTATRRLFNAVGGGSRTPRNKVFGTMARSCSFLRWWGSCDGRVVRQTPCRRFEFDDIFFSNRSGGTLALFLDDKGDVSAHSIDRDVSRIVEHTPSKKHDNIMYLTNAYIFWTRHGAEKRWVGWFLWVSMCNNSQACPNLRSRCLSLLLRAKASSTHDFTAKFLSVGSVLSFWVLVDFGNFSSPT